MGPHVANQLMVKKHGTKAMQQMLLAQETHTQAAANYDLQSMRGLSKPTYKFGHNVLTGEDLLINRNEIHIPGYAKAVNLSISNPFEDMC
jgi:acetoacetyl-[acyl-carrier protein] synthase